ncbi:mitochondrial inner membrane protein [Ditylenchus destructor]|nr:mitochondrial inner membrane protein [Ditylenchus destructor]
MVDEPNEEDVSDDSLVNLPITVVLTHSVAVSFFVDFLTQVGGQNYIDFYLSIEGFKVSVEHQLRCLASGDSAGHEVNETVKEAALFMYHQFLSQEAITRVPLDDSTINKFLARLRNDEPWDSWFEQIQEKLVEILTKDERFYPNFKKSQLYVKMLEELDTSTAQSGTESRQGSPSSEPDGRAKQNDDSNFSTAETRPLHSPTVTAASHITVETLGVGQQGKQMFALYNVRVMKTDSSGQNKNASSWNVIRRYSDFHLFNSVITTKFMNLKNLSFPGKKTFNNLDQMFLERRCKALNEYMKCILQPQLIANNPGLEAEIFDFLSQKCYGSSKNNLSKKLMSDIFVNPILSGVKAFGNAVTSVPDQMSKMNRAANQVFKSNAPALRSNSSSSTSLDSNRVAAHLNENDSNESIPLRVVLLLLDEVFGLRGRNQWFRRRLVALLRQFVHAALGSSINRRIVDAVQWLTSADQVSQYLAAFRDSMWNEAGVLAAGEQNPSSESLRTRFLARCLMLSALPDELRLFIGSTMRRKVLTVVGLTTTAVGAGAGYAYLHPEVVPEEMKDWLKNLEKLDPRKKGESLKAQMPKLPEVANKLAVKSGISEPQKTADFGHAIANGSAETVANVLDSKIKPIDVKKSNEALSTSKPPTPIDQTKLQKELDTKLLDALRDAENKVKVATEAKYKTIMAVKDHSQALKQAVDDGQMGNWNLVTEALHKSENLAKQDIGKESVSRDAVDSLRKVIADAKAIAGKSGSSSLVLNATESANKMIITNLGFILVERSRFKQILSEKPIFEELNSIVPGVDANAKSNKLSEDELNALIAHAYLYLITFALFLIILFIIQILQVQEEQHIAQAIEDQRKADAAIAEAQLDLEIRRVRETTNVDVEKKVHEERKMWEAELESRLQRASLAHAEHLESVIRTQKQLHDIENAKLVEEAVNQERNLHAKQINLSVTKLNAIEHALQNRVTADAENRRAKQYWLACQNLVESIVHGQKAGNGVEARRKALATELTVILDASENDSFIKTLVSCFPKSAIETGVYTEQDLKNRFAKMYTLAKRTAKIDDNGGSLFKYLSSYLQSMLIIELPRSYTPEDKINLAKLDTYDVLSRAKYFVEHDDFESAIRLLQLLEGGQPATLARDWVVDARNYLETRFLAQLLMDHATVTSIRSVY